MFYFIRLVRFVGFIGIDWCVLRLLEHLLKHVERPYFLGFFGVLLPQVKPLCHRKGCFHTWTCGKLLERIYDKQFLQPFRKGTENLTNEDIFRLKDRKIRIQFIEH
jgi:hypothetical protein